MTTSKDSLWNLERMQRKDFLQASPLSPDEVKHCIDRLKTGDEVSRDRLIVASLPLVLQVSRWFSGEGVSVEDIRQTGVIGLISAINGYSPDDGDSFSAYAKVCIANEILRSFKDWITIRLPKNKVKLLKDIKKAQRILLIQEGYSGYSCDRIASVLQQNPDYQDKCIEDLTKDVEELIPFTFPVISTDRTITLNDDDSSLAFIDTVPSEEEDITTRVTELEFNKTLIAAFVRSGIRSELDRKIVIEGQGSPFERRNLFFELTTGDVRQGLNEKQIYSECPFSRRFRWQVLSLNTE